LKEFVPSVLGEAGHADKELVPTSSGFYGGYSSTNRGGAIDAVALAAFPALTSLKRHESSNLERQLVLAANKVNLNVAEQETSVHGWDPSALLLHAAKDHGMPSYVEFVHFCSSGRLKVSKPHRLLSGPPVLNSGKSVKYFHRPILFILSECHTVITF
jgi:hypothetical protein